MPGVTVAGGGEEGEEGCCHTQTGQQSWPPLKTAYW